MYNYVCLEFPSGVFYIVEECTFMVVKARVKDFEKMFGKPEINFLKRLLSNASRVTLPSDISAELKDSYVEFCSDTKPGDGVHVVKMVHTAGLVLFSSEAINSTYLEFKKKIVKLYNIESVLDMLKLDYDVRENKFSLPPTEVSLLKKFKLMMRQQMISDFDLSKVQTKLDLERVLKKLLFSSVRIYNADKKLETYKSRKQSADVVFNVCSCFICPCISGFLTILAIHFSIATSMLVEKTILNQGITLKDLYEMKSYRFVTSRYHESFSRREEVSSFHKYMDDLRDKSITCDMKYNANTINNKEGKYIHMSMCAMRHALNEQNRLKNCIVLCAEEMLKDDTPIFLANDDAVSGK